MKPSRWTILLLLVLTTAASAALVTGQHASCEAVWDTGTAAVTIPPHLDCHDGDPTCDTDGAADHNGEVTVAGKGLYLLSSDCTPLGDSAADSTDLDIKLPFTTGAATPLVGPVPCPDPSGPQLQDDGCNAGSCTASCTGAACVGTDAAGNCVDAKGGLSQLCCSNAHGHPVLPHQGGRQHHAGGASWDERADAALRRHVLHPAHQVHAHQHHHRPAGTRGAAAALAGVGAAVNPLGIYGA